MRQFTMKRSLVGIVPLISLLCLLLQPPAVFQPTVLIAGDNIDGFSSTDNTIFDRYWDRRLFDGTPGFDGFIKWLHNPTGIPSGLAPTTFEAEVEAAFNNWDAVDDAFPENPLVPIVNFAGAASTTDAFALDGENAVVWKAGAPSDVLAITPCWFLTDPTTTFDDGSGTRLPTGSGSIPFPGPAGVTYPRGTLIDCGMEFDSADPWVVGVGTGSGEFDIQSIATHEGGHFIGLSHSTVGLQEVLTAPNPLSASLVPFGHPNDIEVRSLEEDDKASALRTYARTSSPPIDETVGGLGVIELNLKKYPACGPATGLAVWAYLTAGGLTGATRIETFSGSHLRAGLLGEPVDGSVTLNVPPGGPYTIYAQTFDSSDGASATAFSALRYNNTTIHSNTLDPPDQIRGFDNLATVTSISAGQTIDLGDIGILGCWTPVPGPAPDLQIDSVTAPSSATLGSQISVTSSFSNQGPVNAGAFEVGFYFSQDPNVAIDDVFSGSICNFLGLSSGAANTCNGLITIPPLVPGVYYVWAIADSLNQIGETNESNNGSVSAPVTISVDPLNPIVNGSFETGDFSGWTIKEIDPASNPNMSLTVDGAGVEFPAPSFACGFPWFCILDYFASDPTD